MLARKKVAVLAFAALLAGCGGPDDGIHCAPPTVFSDRLVALVANNINGTGSVSAYEIDAATGALTPRTGSPYAAGANPNSVVAIAGDARFAYVANSSSGYISGYRV
jgi:6-phosphogluconolactonase (cycloisomerase 2 family)